MLAIVVSARQWHRSHGKAGIQQQISLELLIIAGLRYMEGRSPGLAGVLGAGMQLDVNEIQKFLPHRYPFLLIDKVVEMERYKRSVDIKHVQNHHVFLIAAHRV